MDSQKQIVLKFVIFSNIFINSQSYYLPLLNLTQK